MNRIRKYRLENNLTTYKLAEISNISQSYVVALEHLERKPTLHIARQISKALNVPLNELFPEPNTETNTTLSA